MKSEEENELIRRCREGNLKAFGELVNEYKSRVYAVAFRIVGNPADADDLSQEAFIRAYRSLVKFRGESSFYTWIYKIVTNLCLNHRKKNMKIIKSSFDERFVDPDSRKAGSNPLPGEGKETRAEIFKALGSLKDSFRMALDLVVFQGLSHREAAELAGCSEGTISWRIFKARQQLREQLAAYI
ncbi:MAG: RNA polymerase sigma factor [Candidatus Euphemobacter frigidus]|nr:RNA polymerase sigma factor [Candidatus Euphemobacter frigidus]MDP8276480.1 RNA polymerase sigma factor [Candidatus Euphemobacter frigidus]